MVIWKHYNVWPSIAAITSDDVNKMHLSLSVCASFSYLKATNIVYRYVGTVQFFSTGNIVKNDDYFQTAHNVRSLTSNSGAAGIVSSSVLDL